MSLNTDVRREGLGCFRRWLVRKRVAISAVAFTTVITILILHGARPREFVHGYDFESILGTFAILCGLAIRSWAAGTLVKNKALATTGPYRMVRNPLYFGSFLMMAGVCLLVDEPLVPFIAVTLVLAIYILAVRNEERTMTKRFGEAWSDYAKRTPRLIPRSLSIDFADWQWDQWLKNHEYAAVFAVAFAFVAIEVWEHL